ncbi:MAG: polysaccharide biosynthesis tyrosine autokinase [Clostridia bacterium]|nr:polysaccharide biosynthesis tyrosine autokinase [Clostridia bacterium]
MENYAKQQKAFGLKELFYVLKKNWLVEAILFIVVVAMGVVYTRINTDYYISHATVVLRAEVGSSSSQYNDTVLSKMYLTTVSDLMKDDSIIDRAIDKAKAEKKDSSISAGALTVSFDEDSLMLKLTYRDNDKKASIEKLDAIISVCEEISSSGEFFPAEIKIVKISKETKSASASDDGKIITFAGIGALIAVGAYAIIMYFAKDRISSVDRLEAVTGRKNFVTIEKKKSGNIALPLGEGEHAGSHIEIDLAKLSDTLIYMSSDDSNKVFQVQSCLSGEGKTTVSTNLAKALGESQRKTLIIDCDFSKPSIHRIFKLHRACGITDYFKGEKTFDEIVKPTGVDHVDLITCGERISNHTIFFASPKFKAIIEEAKTKYDFIILDCAPVKALSDYINISAVADATLLVVGSDKLSARDLDYTVRELEACNANLIGTVFNFCTSENKKRYNYYYYYRKKDNK